MSACPRKPRAIPDRFQYQLRVSQEEPCVPPPQESTWNRCRDRGLLRHTWQYSCGCCLTGWQKELPHRLHLDAERGIRNCLAGASLSSLTASAGHTSRQVPHPVHRKESTRKPQSLSSRIAPCWHISEQLPQPTHCPASRLTLQGNKPAGLGSQSVISTSQSCDSRARCESSALGANPATLRRKVLRRSGCSETFTLLRLALHAPGSPCVTRISGRA